MKGKGRYRRNRNKKEAKKMLSPVVGLMDIRSPHFSAFSSLRGKTFEKTDYL